VSERTPSFARARLCALCAACAFVCGIAAIEFSARNHERALELHESQRLLDAQLAQNARLRLELRAHVPGRPNAASAAREARP
jgi:hypothetical protein